MDQPPVAWLYTDIEGSTRLWQTYPALMPGVYDRHDAIIREAVTTHGGKTEVTIGDAFQIRGASVHSIVSIAIAAQRRLQAEQWPIPETLRVRMAIHQNSVSERDQHTNGRHFLQLALGAAHGEQILLTSSALAALTPLDPAWRVSDCGHHLLRGHDTAVHLHQVSADPLRSEFPPLNSRSTHPSNLPPLSPLKPSEQSVANRLLNVMCTGSSRLVTLVSPSGSRSLHVGMAAAERIRPTFPGGVFLIPGPTRDITASILAALDLRTDQQPSVESTAQAIGDTHLLLVLSGMDLAEEALVPTLAHLLGKCPQLHLLAIADRSLGSRWERIFTMDDGVACVQ